MFDIIDRSAVQAYSQGLITRREVGERVGRYVGFGMLLANLHHYGLKLPVFPTDAGSEGVELVRRLCEQAAARDG